MSRDTMTEYRFKVIEEKSKSIIYYEESTDLTALKSKMSTFMNDPKYTFAISQVYGVKNLTLIIEQYCPLCKQWDTVVQLVDFIQ